jgi:4,5-DOPA dioxygenase extradiol
MSSAIPALFLSHGAPTLVLEDNSTTRFWSSWLSGHGRPSAVLAVSAHWQTDGLSITEWDERPLLYDFYGFPEALYRMRYRAPGAPALARRARELIAAAGLGDARPEATRGLDHGAWAPMVHLLPKADVPIVQVSLPLGWKPAALYALGRALAPLREEGVWIVGSGGAVHNLGAVRMDSTEVPTWAQVFDEWLRENVLGWNTQDLFEYWRMAPHGMQAHPTEEHILPLFVPMGAGDAKREAKIEHQGFMHGCLSMLALSFS